MAVLCSNCAGKLIFNPATQRLECATCGSSFRPEDVEDKNAELHSKYMTQEFTSAVTVVRKLSRVIRKRLLFVFIVVILPLFLTGSRRNINRTDLFRSR